MNKKNIAVIIPTRNEEKDLPYLLNSLKQQDLQDFTTIIADANSEDNTKQIARENGCVVVKGGLPYLGRNEGAKEAIKRGLETLVFLDADLIVGSKSFLRDCIKEMKERELDLAATLTIAYDLKKPIDIDDVVGTVKKSEDWRYKFIYGVDNFVKNILQKTKTPGMDCSMFCTSEVFKKTKGFPAKEYGEDAAFCTLAAQNGFKFRMLDNEIYISTRRFEKTGIYKMTAKYIGINLIRVFGYKFNADRKRIYFKE